MKKEEPLISVVVPVFSVELYLDKCLESITRQSYKNLEIILVDDGSADRSGELCDKWAEKDDRIKVIHQENKGVSAARNAGLSVIKGEYFGFVDADDTIHPEMIRKLMDLILGTGADISVCQYLNEECGRIRQAKYESVSRRQGTGVIDKRDAVRYFLEGPAVTGPVVWNKLYHVSLKENLFFPEGYVYEDNEVTLKLLTAAKKIAVTDEILYYKSFRVESITHTHNAANDRDYIRSARVVEELVKDAFPGDEDLIRAAKHRTLWIQMFVWRMLQANDDAESVKLADEIREDFLSGKEEYKKAAAHKPKSAAGYHIITDAPRIGRFWYRRSSGKRKLIRICAAAVVIAAIFAGIAAAAGWITPGPGAVIKDVRIDNAEGYPVVYTLDASEPESDSLQYSSPLTLSPVKPYLATPEIIDESVPEKSEMKAEGFPAAAVLRYAAVLPDGQTGQTVTCTYFPGTDLSGLFPDTPVISISVDPDDLTDYETGIMCKGKIFDEWMKTPGYISVMKNKEWWLVEANYMQKGKEWERPAHIEIFENGSKEPSVSEDCGLRLHGIASRQYAQKGFNIYFRDDYGIKKLEYDLIPGNVSEDGKEIETYKSFIIDNGGNCTELLKYREALLQDLAKEAGLDVTTQASRQAVLFLNGEYWGVYMITEKFSDRFFQDHYGVDGDNVIIFEDGALDEGTEEDNIYYEEYFRYSEKDLSDAGTWDEFNKIVDTGSMADYYAYSIYTGNADFRDDKNVSIWRTRDPENGNEYGDGKWRFILNDIDYAAGLYGIEYTEPSCDTLAYAKDNNKVFNSALKNPKFRQMVAERLSYLRQFMSYERISKIIDIYQKRFDTVSAMSYERFGYDDEKHGNEYGVTTDDEFKLRNFFDKRGDYIKEQIIPALDA